MKIIEFHRGCNANPSGCMGPREDFYTLFGTEFRLLGGYLVISILVGLMLFALLMFLRKKQK
jgi:hypothetical protein